MQQPKTQNFDLVDKPATRAEEVQVIKKLEASAGPIAAGQGFCLISKTWYSNWLEEKPSADSSIGPITNSTLITPPLSFGPHQKQHADSNSQPLLLREQLQEGDDYVLILEKAFEQLQKWYGGGPKVLRYAIEEKTEQGEYVRVEVYPFRFSISAPELASGKSAEISISRLATMRDLLTVAVKSLGLDSSQSYCLISVFAGERRALYIPARVHHQTTSNMSAINRNGGGEANDHTADEVDGKSLMSSSIRHHSSSDDPLSLRIGDAKVVSGQVLELWTIRSWNLHLYGSAASPAAPSTDVVVTTSPYFQNQKPATTDDYDSAEMPVASSSSSASSRSLFQTATAILLPKLNPQQNKNNQTPSSSSSAGGGNGISNAPPMGTSAAALLRPVQAPVIQHREKMCGLHNLGNTCFMNSALQCLSSTPLLLDYFLSGKYLSHLNRTNPLGAKGQLAEAYGNLLNEMNSATRAIAPHDLKHIIGRFQPRFSGYNQQDAQELLAYLLDGLHEDLNRVLNKPYTELKSYENTRPDAEVAREAWQMHLRRNQSIIVDLFQGQLKSTLICPDCKKVSVTFDPFMYLSLPIAVDLTRSVDVIVDRGEFLPTRMRIRVPKRGTVSDLKKALCAQLNRTIPTTLAQLDRVIICLCKKSRVEQVFLNTMLLSSVPFEDNTGGRIFAFFQPDPREGPQENVISITVAQRTFTQTGPRSYGIPFFVHVVPERVTGRQLYAMVHHLVKRFVSSNTPFKAVDIAHAPSASAFGFSLRRIRSQRSVLCPASCPLGGSCPACVITMDDNAIRPPLTADTAFHLDWTDQIEFDSKEENQLQVDASCKRPKDDKEGLTLGKCLELFCTQEQLGPNDEWFCPHCKALKQAFKKFDLFSLPRYLVIHLKRFQFSRITREKISALVDFPLNGLDLSPWIINDSKNTTNANTTFSINGNNNNVSVNGNTAATPPPIYDLYAVSNHSGGLGGGHYTAFAKHPVTKKWHLLNDASIEQLHSTEQICSNSAYLLFYERRS